MTDQLSPITIALLRELQQLRVATNKSSAELDAELVLGPGWIEEIEAGRVVPDLDAYLFLANKLGKDLMSIAPDGLTITEDMFPSGLARTLGARQIGPDLDIHFRYAAYDATYRLKKAKKSEFDEVVKELRDGLALLVQPNAEEKQVKATAVRKAFKKAVDLWPHSNPSDIWWFIIYRAFCEPFNHPAEYSRLAFEQSWKRTGGWALEQVLVAHYAKELSKHGIVIEIVEGERKQKLLDSLEIPDRLESDKVDVFLTDAQGECFGIVNVKASFAERRTDDVPMSQALIRAGYYSALWTMDCKSTPSSRPVNRGELGAVDGRRSAKRKDIEDDGWFSACFSYNSNTKPTPRGNKVKARIHVCDFRDPNDAFVKDIVSFRDNRNTRGS